MAVAGAGGHQETVGRGEEGFGGRPMTSFIFPDWLASQAVRAASTLRTGGVSLAPYDSFNLALHVGDEPSRVAENRLRVRTELQLPGEPFWLDQVHGNRVLQADESTADRQADAAVA